MACREGGYLFNGVYGGRVNHYSGGNCSSPCGPCGCGPCSLNFGAEHRGHFSAPPGGYLGWCGSRCYPALKGNGCCSPCTRKCGPCGPHLSGCCGPCGRS